MKKLLQINPVLRASTSTGRIMQEIAGVARANGWKTYIAYSKGRDGVPENPCALVPVGNKLSVMRHGLLTRLTDRHGLGSVRATRAFIRKIQEIHPDIIHIHNIHGYFLNYRILFDYLSQAGIPVIWTVHDCWLYTGHCYYYSFAGCEKWKTGCGNCPQLRDFPRSWLVDRSAANYRDKKNAFTSIPHDLMTFVPVSRWIESEMRQSFLKDADIRVIHNGIDLDVFRVYPQSDVRQKYGIGNKKMLLGVASIWMREKGWDDFLEMSGKLTDDEVIVLVGVKDEQRKNLPDNIIPIRRTENIAGLAQLYSAADVFVNPTWQDNYPTVNLESISCGTPIVTYNTGGSIEPITEETGLVVNRGDVDALLAAARILIANGKAAYQYKCRRFAERNFKKEDRYQDYLTLYNERLEVIKSRSSKSKSL